MPLSKKHQLTFFLHSPGARTPDPTQTSRALADERCCRLFGPQRRSAQSLDLCYRQSCTAQTRLSSQSHLASGLGLRYQGHVIVSSPSTICPLLCHRRMANIYACGCKTRGENAADLALTLRAHFPKEPFDVRPGKTVQSHETEARILSDAWPTNLSQRILDQSTHVV
jgi:hypothetical protein